MSEAAYVDEQDALDAYIDATLSGDGADRLARDRVARDVARIVQDLRAVAVGTSIRAGFVADLDARLLREAAETAQPSGGRRGILAQTGRRVRGIWRGSALARVAAVALLVLVVGATMWSAPAIGAQLARLACFVPGLGIQACPGLVSAGPVSVQRGEMTLTISQLLSAGGETIVRLEIAGVTMPAPGAGPQTPPASQLQLFLHDERGRTYQPTRYAWGGVAVRAAEPFGALEPFGTVEGELRFAPLDPSVRRVELAVIGPEPIGTWSVEVPLVPTGTAGLASGRPGGDAVLHGVTVRIASAIADRERTAIQLEARGAPPIRFVRGLGRGVLQSDLVLRDDQGRTYKELPSSPQVWPDRGGAYIQDAVFPALPEDVRSAELVIPFAVVEEDTDEVKLLVPIAGARVGEPISLDVSLQVGPYGFHVSSARIVDQRGQRLLTLDLDLGDRREGRTLVGVGRVWVNGQDRGFQAQSGGEVGQWSQLSVPMPDAAGDSVVLTLRQATVAVDGPWRLQVPLREP